MIQKDVIFSLGIGNTAYIYNIHSYHHKMYKSQILTTYFCPKTTKHENLFLWIADTWEKDFIPFPSAKKSKTTLELHNEKEKKNRSDTLTYTIKATIVFEGIF